MKKITYFLLVSIAFCWACRKPKEPVYPPYINPHTPLPCQPKVWPLTNPLLLTLKYKEGSYWVFKDSLSGDIDTLLVQSMIRYPYLLYPDLCDTLETFMVTLAFKHETIGAFKLMYYQIFQDSVIFRNSFVWQSDWNNLVLYTDHFVGTGGCKMHDSLRINNVYYKNVGESSGIQFVSSDPNRMESQSMKTFLSAEWGPLQLDFRDRLSGQLTGRRKVIARNVLR